MECVLRACPINTPYYFHLVLKLLNYNPIQKSEISKGTPWWLFTAKHGCGDSVHIKQQCYPHSRSPDFYLRSWLQTAEISYVVLALSGCGVEQCASFPWFFWDYGRQSNSMNPEPRNPQMAANTTSLTKFLSSRRSLKICEGSYASSPSPLWKTIPQLNTSKILNYSKSATMEYHIAI